MGFVTKLAILVPNNKNFQSGSHKVKIKFRDIQNAFTFRIDISVESKKIESMNQNELNVIKEKEQSLDFKKREVKLKVKKTKRIVACFSPITSFTIVIFFLVIILMVLTDPFARQTDAGLGPGITLIFLIALGFFLIPLIYKELIRTKK